MHLAASNTLYDKGRYNQSYSTTEPSYNGVTGTTAAEFTKHKKYHIFFDFEKKVLYL